MHGWLLINKPEGMSSTAVVGLIKSIINERPRGYKFKVGHAGTLDVAACGLLLVAVGEATKTISFATNMDKGYTFTIKWGENRDTIDREGKIVRTHDKIPSMEELKAITNRFRGEIEQIPPKFSAVHISGKRAYDLARKGIEFELRSRRVITHLLEVIEHNEERRESTFKVFCSKGFYVRSLARDIAESVDACGYVSFLRRDSIKIFSLENGIRVEYLQELSHNTAKDELNKLILPVHSVLDDILVHNATEQEAKSLKCGRGISYSKSDKVTVAVFSKENLVALCKVENGWLKPNRVFNFD